MSNEADTYRLLSVRDLVVSFATDGGVLRALDGVSFDIKTGSATAIVGESGSGKSVTALSIMRLVPAPAGRIDRGEILFEGRDLLKLSESEMRQMRGGRIAMIFQEPMTSLNPVYTVGSQISEAIRLHRRLSRSEAKARAIELLAKVGMPRPAAFYDGYAHELSGGMRQRVMIAMALACDPALLIADEPTTALDMMTQSQILAIIRELSRKLGMSLLLITHDLAIVGEMADDVVVLYAGHVVERGATEETLARPLHPYTKALLESIPPDRPEGYRKGRRLPTIEGSPLDMRARPNACSFEPRCSRAFERCRTAAPALFEREGRFVRCFLYEESASVAEPIGEPAASEAP